MKSSDLFNYTRRSSDAISVGNLKLGGAYPIRIQSMANTDTNDIEGSVEQGKRMIKAGAELVRYTTQGLREAESLKRIQENLRMAGSKIPLVADVHFTANVADVVAQYVEKVRVNPGNYVSGVKMSGDTSDYSDEEYQREFGKIRDRFTRLLDICKQHHTAIRIGVNHGSLSDRMMNRYGDTPQGMAESCLEFLRICRENDFGNVVISVKASNTQMMVYTVRLLVDEMEKENMHFPIHLGVTEAGDGEDGRIKSSVGIGAALADGIGDTVRVSLSEEPEVEIPVADELVKYVVSRAGHLSISGAVYSGYKRYEYDRRVTEPILEIGGENVPVVVVAKDGGFSVIPDALWKNGEIQYGNGAVYTVFQPGDKEKLRSSGLPVKFWALTYNDLADDTIGVLKNVSGIVILLSTSHQNGFGEQRAFFHKLLINGCRQPVIICRKYNESNLQTLQIKAAADIGPLFIDGFGDGIFIANENDAVPVEAINSLAFGILQAARVRTSKTEYISCPSCGRTLFNLQTVVAKVKARTSHLKGLKIAVMGCIVNGPGEMADADYGYVGAGRGKVSLYKRRICVERNIPEDIAVDKLVELIQENGDWEDK